MFEIDHINRKLSELQSSSFNCGGTWEARLFNKLDEKENALSVLRKVFKDNPKYDNLTRHKEFEEKGEWNPEESKLTKNLELINLLNWENYFDERIDHWSNFELISKEEMALNFKQDKFLEKKKRFKEELDKILLDRKLLKVYKINEDKFDTYDLWKEQIFEDFVFELESEILTISFGWSS